MISFQYALVLKSSLLFLLLLSGRLSFYVISNINCESCEKSIRAVENLFPESIFLKYDISEGDILERFNMISGIINETFLPLPLFIVFANDSLRAIVAGELPPESWEIAVKEEAMGVPLYVNEGMGKVLLRKVLVDKEKIAELKEVLTVDYRRENSLADFKMLIGPIFIASAMDALNICMMNVLLILLALTFHSMNRKVALRVGIAFSLGIFIIRFIMGLCAIRAFGIFPEVRYILVVFALSMGALRLEESISGSKRHLPKGFRAVINKYLRLRLDHITGFAAGAIAALLIMPCSSAPYFLALSLLRKLMLEGLLLLVVYNLIIMIPLLAAIALVYAFDLKAENVRMRILEKRRLINLLEGLTLISLSIFILLSSHPMGF
jgi:cytochrome c biogenesis protein CcdA